MPNPTDTDTEESRKESLGAETPPTESDTSPFHLETGAGADLPHLPPELASEFSAGAPRAEGVAIPDRRSIEVALEEVFDPEIPVNIYDLGLIYEIDFDAFPDGIDITMTLTAPGCPVAGILPQQVADAAAGVEGAGLVRVRLTWEPAWDLSRMSDDARTALGFLD